MGVRIRPPLQNKNEERCIKVVSKKSLLFSDGTRSHPRLYIYDNVYDEASTQEEVYQTTTAGLVKDVLDGFNAAVFAYGATGSGKTHTMLGPNPRKAATPASETAPPNTSQAGGDGLMVKAIADIFQHIEQAEDPKKFKVSDDYRVINFYFHAICPLNCQHSCIWSPLQH